MSADCMMHVGAHDTSGVIASKHGDGRLRRALGYLMILISVVALLLVAACRGVRFDGQGLGQFPPKGVAQYHANLYIETQDSGSLYDVQNKDIWVRVADLKGNRLLDDRLSRRRCRMVEGKVVWSDFDNLEVELMEVGDADSNDPLSVALAKSGPRSMLKLKYHYSAALKKFERVN